MSLGRRRRSRHDADWGSSNGAGAPVSEEESGEEMEATTSVVPTAFTAERQRQIESEGYDSRHDDEHVNGELLAVARLYYQRALGQSLEMRDVVVAGGPPTATEMTIRVPVGFPWDA